MTLMKWLIGVPLVVLAIAFAVANGESVSFTWSPIHDPVNWPLYALVLAALMIGFIIGSFMTWIAGHAQRKERRTLAKDNKKLQGEVDKLQTAQTQQETLRIAQRNLTEDGIY